MLGNRLDSNLYFLELLLHCLGLQLIQKLPSPNEKFGWTYSFNWYSWVNLQLQLMNTKGMIQLQRVSMYFFHHRLNLVSCNPHLMKVANDPRNKISWFVAYHQYWLYSNLIYKDFNTIIFRYLADIISLPVDSSNFEL